MAVLLDGSVSLVGLQFSFSNHKVVPRGMKAVAPETPEAFRLRQSRNAAGNGISAIDPVENVFLMGFLSGLRGGYQMVDAFYQERINPKDPTMRYTYPMVRFLFARHEYAEIADEFRSVRKVRNLQLEELCSQAMWRVRALLNPYMRNGVEVPGQYFISIGLEARTPRFQPDGNPVVIWQKDERGRRLGDAPVPVAPEYFLRVKDGVLLVE